MFRDSTRRQMRSNWLPVDRRRLEIYDVDHSLLHLFTVCRELKLFVYIDRPAMKGLALKLFKLVMRRHTHLWDKVN